VLASVRRPSSGVVIVVGPEKYLCVPEEFFRPCNILAYYATNAVQVKRGEDPSKGLRELLKARK
jgi:hypothetical protein